MGSSADAHIAWGVDLVEGEYGEMDSDVRQRIEDWDMGKLEIPGTKDVVGYAFYGDFCTETAEVLTVSRTYSDVNWGCKAIDAATLTEPTEDEVAALGRVLDAIGFKGDRTPKLLLFATYG